LASPFTPSCDCSFTLLNLDERIHTCPAQRTAIAIWASFTGCLVAVSAAAARTELAAREDKALSLAWISQGSPHGGQIGLNRVRAVYEVPQTVSNLKFKWD
jgi:hypothetical protein